MKIARTLQLIALLSVSSSAVLAEDAAPPAHALPSLPLFELPAQASDNARLHVGLAHARRDSHRGEHTSKAQTADVGSKAAHAKDGQTQRAAAASHGKTAPSQLAAARDRLAAAQARRDAAQLRTNGAQEHRAAAAEHRADAQERRAAAAQHREAATERQANAQEHRAAAQERRASAGQK
ncbi:MAG: hypothetical protein ABI895_23355 [Deltaproteobacteria bacterium]